jgi:hypothetical protein
MLPTDEERPFPVDRIGLSITVEEDLPATILFDQVHSI